MSSARAVVQIDSLLQHLSDNLQTGPGACPNLARKLASTAHSRRYHSGDTCQGFAMGWLSSRPLGRP